MGGINTCRRMQNLQGVTDADLPVDRIEGTRSDIDLRFKFGGWAGEIKEINIRIEQTPPKN